MSSLQESLETSPSKKAKSTAPAVKFSSDTKRLQDIDTIKKSPVGLQIKSVIDLLKSKREILTAEEIKERCFVDINSEKAAILKNSLMKNPKVRYDGGRFSYKATHDLKDKDQLLQKIRENTEGIPVAEFEDAYPNVMEDLKALEASGSIWLLPDSKPKGVVAHPNDPKMQHVKVDDEIKKLFREIELTRDMLDIERDLLKNGMKPATNTTARRAKAQVHGINPKQKNKKKKNKKISKRTKLTNPHLPELFKEEEEEGRDQQEE